ncbi:hypothetical protein DE146DRAFT_630628 [Phaeosphaeria sp. MPI-PUGE-AT-0046c]|nr:hypothetical protein DE146DRAFT_630628 [Phaeosphaeria sp. MPI-PUGE-AT-0046c]
MNRTSEGICTAKLEQVTQSLYGHPLFERAYIARNPLRCLHRDDGRPDTNAIDDSPPIHRGCLLAMSPAAGVDYLHTKLQNYLQSPPEEFNIDNFASGIAEIFREFSETGTDTWHRKNVEWFLVHQVTEPGTTLYNIRQGYSVPSLMDAYGAIVHELNSSHSRSPRRT